MKTESPVLPPRWDEISLTCSGEHTTPEKCSPVVIPAITSCFPLPARDPTYRKASNNFILHSILWMQENSKGYDSTDGSATCRHINGLKWKLQQALSIFRCTTPSLGVLFCHFTTRYTFHPISLRAEHPCPVPQPPWLCPAPLTHGGQELFYPGGTPGLLLPPSRDSCFFLLVSSNTYIVWGETGSIQSPQQAIHSRAAGEAQGSPCPLHSWMSFVQSSGLGSFPSQSQAISERWKKERKCFVFLHCLFFLCLFGAKLCYLVALEGCKSILGEEKGNDVWLINTSLGFLLLY